MSKKIKSPQKKQKTEQKELKKKSHLIKILLICLLIVVLLTGSLSAIYFFDVGGIKTYAQNKYAEYLYNLPEAVAQRELEARLAQELAEKKEVYLGKLEELNLLLSEYDEATSSAGMASASAEIYNKEIKELVGSAISSEDENFILADGKLNEFENRIEQVALENTQNYYLGLLEEVNKTLAEFKKNLSKTVGKILTELEEEIKELVASESFGQVLEKITAYSKEVMDSKPKPVASSDSGETLASATVNNTPPGAGYSSQVVEIDGQRFTVNIVAGDMGSTKIIVDTASDHNCKENCPVMSLSEYVSRNGAFAGINGSYFMPYNGSNSFDGFVKSVHGGCINENAGGNRAVFNVGNMSFTSSWGCQGDDGAISNYPMLIEGGQAKGEHSDPKISATKSNRSFVGHKGSTAYIGIVRNSTSIEAGKVLQAMGLENALGLDAGDSTALWSGGYKAGPGRGLPNAILFVRR